VIVVPLVTSAFSSTGSSSILGRNKPPSPSTNPTLPFSLKRSKSSPPPFRASCFQNSQSLNHDTSITLTSAFAPPSPVSRFSSEVSASHKNRTMSQFALAPRVLVRRSIEFSAGSCVCGWRSGGIREEGGMVARCFVESFGGVFGIGIAPGCLSIRWKVIQVVVFIQIISLPSPSCLSHRKLLFYSTLVCHFSTFYIIPCLIIGRCMPIVRGACYRWPMPCKRLH
jgi:hypothetical protein